MKLMMMALICLIAIGLIAPAVYSATAEEEGKKLFNDPAAFSGKKACNECHPGGRGLEKSGAKTKFNIMGKTQNSLEEAVNVCIVNANKGKAIDEKSDQMKNIVAYIKSLGKKAAPGY